MEMSGQLHAPAALPQGEEHLAPIWWEVGWAPEPVWMLWRRQKFPATTGTSTPDHPACSLALYHVSVITSVSPWPNEVICTDRFVVLVGELHVRSGEWELCWLKNAPIKGRDMHIYMIPSRADFISLHSL